MNARPVSLNKRYTDEYVRTAHTQPTPEWELAYRRLSAHQNAACQTGGTGFQLVGHRDGLQANDPVSLASALTILAQRGHTAHLGHCNHVPGEGCVNCEGRC
jgi:hypothetical protein